VLRGPGLHILLLADRDWNHPEAGGTGATLDALVSRWTAAGHHVTLIAGAYPGCIPVERPHPLLEIHRMGTRLTVFPRAAMAFRKGLGRDADVVLEVVNGIAFFTPLWRSLRAPTTVMVQHVHQRHYVMELGWRGEVGALLLERLPLRCLYRGPRRTFTISHASRQDLIALGVPGDSIDVVYLGVEQPHTNGNCNGNGVLPPVAAAKSRVPTLLYFGRLKRYKRLDILLDVLDKCPEAVLEVAGDGDYRPAFEAEVRRRGLRDRVVLHGFVPAHAKGELYTRAWLNITASGAEGWGLTVMEAAIHSTPSAALRVGGLAESIVDGETGLLANDPPQLCARVGEILASPELRDRLGAAAAERARTFSWDQTADDVLELLSAAVARNGSQPVAVHGRSARPGFRPRAVRLITGWDPGVEPIREETTAIGTGADTTSAGASRMKIERPRRRSITSA
jgi:glycosyltransferase involved in cell wall biosynthesis